MSSGESRYDLVLRNGLVVDGTGNKGRPGDVAIRGQRIVAIGALDADAEIGSEIDVQGLVVAPGFIDVHTHDDAVLIDRPAMTPKITQGVTTVIAGNCGISAAPYLNDGDPEGFLRAIFKSRKFVSPSFREYVEKVKLARPAVNCAFLTGHTTLRMQVMGNDLERPATNDEIERMRSLLDDALAQGSLGLSTGLYYDPASCATTREVVEVGRPLHKYGAIYTSHMRDESDGVLESIHETLEIGNATRVPVVISHHKCMGQRNFGRSIETLAAIERALSAGREVSLDVYPYTASSTVLHENFVKVASRTLVTWCDSHPEYMGRDLSDVATELNCTQLEAIPKLFPAGATYFLMDENDVERILTFPHTMVGSDGLPDDVHPHPRLWGTFSRVLGRYVREKGVLSLEDAVHRMSGLSARNFGLRNRGVLTEGNYADICVFDPNSVLDEATYDQPKQPSSGIVHVLVNGAFALRNGAPTDERAGQILLREPRD